MVNIQRITLTLAQSESSSAVLLGLALQERVALARDVVEHARALGGGAELCLP